MIADVYGNEQTAVKAYFPSYTGTKFWEPCSPITGAAAAPTCAARGFTNIRRSALRRLQSSNEVYLITGTIESSTLNIDSHLYGQYECRAQTFVKVTNNTDDPITFIDEIAEQCTYSPTIGMYLKYSLPFYYYLQRVVFLLRYYLP